MGQKLIHNRKNANMSRFSLVLLVFILKMATSVLAENDEKFSFINMKKVANMGFADEVAGDKTGGWFDQGPNNDLRSLPGGVQKFGGIPFYIIKPESNSGKSCIVLRGNNMNFLPVDSGLIEIKRKAQLIYFLTACGWNTTVGNEVAFITVRYRQDGLYLNIPVRFKKETAGWWNPEQISNGNIFWQGHNPSADVGIYCSGWINPYPEQEIESISFVSTNSGAVPAFIAATIVTNPVTALKLKVDLQEKMKKIDSQQANSQDVILTVDFNGKGIQVADDAASLALGFNITDDYLKASRGLVDAGKGKPFFRFQISNAEPSLAKGILDFTRLDQYIDYIYAAGGEPMLCFGPLGPAWMRCATAECSLTRNWKPQSLEEYASYCEAIVRHYNIDRKTPVKWWQIGNETELSGWSYKYYMQVYNFIAPRLKKIDPEIKLGGPVNCSPNIGWAEELLREAGPFVDFLSYHQYGYSEPFDSPSNYIMEKTPQYMQAVSLYQKQAYNLAMNKSMPVIVTEANINPRCGNPEGTDPKIRTMFNVAWYTSALSQFVLGGGRGMCYFTLDGGFGACWDEQGKFKIHPVYHAIWLFRKMGQGKIISVVSSSPLVEAYAFRDGAVKRLIVINKMLIPVKVELNFQNAPPGNGRLFALNYSNAKACSDLDDKGNIRFLTARHADWNMDKITLDMEGYEVSAWETTVNKGNDK